MDALGDILEPYSEQIAKFAGTVTCLQFLSGIVLINDIRKRGSSDAYPVDPFLGGIIITILSLKLGAIMNDAAMIQVNIIGLFINFAFFGAFYYFASPAFRSKIWSKLGVTGVFLMAFVAYTNFEDPAKIEFRLGMVLTLILVYLVGSPLLGIGKIIENKSTDGMPFPLILSGTIVAASWGLYGISIRNSVVAYQNIFLLLLSIPQLALFAIYPNTPVKQSAKTSPSKKSAKKIN